MSPAAEHVSAVPQIRTTPSSKTPIMSLAQKESVLEWYKGEFAAANAIIDALCHHIVQITTNIDDPYENKKSSFPIEYECAFAAIHRRRLNWIPVLQTQKYFSISDVATELKKAAASVVAKKSLSGGDLCDESGKCNGDVISQEDDSPVSDITDTGSHEVHANMDHAELCNNHENCTFRREQISLTKGFVAKEPVKGRMVNVVKGLKLFEDVFDVSELCKLRDFVEELRTSGQNGELLGETYILFNKDIKTNKREQIQLGVPLFGHVKDDATDEQPKSNNEPIPELIQSVIDHLVQWQVLPENRKPNGCIINYFDQGEYSQPFLKPPHLDQPLCTLVLSESTMAFGRTLVNDGEGNFKGQLMLSMKEGSVLVMRNNSADMARHAMCASPTKRVSITLTRIRPDHLQTQQHPTPLSAPLNQQITLWNPTNIPNPHTLQNGAPIEILPTWGIIRSPMVMLAPVRPMIMSPKTIPHGGTGVFLPWTDGSRKHAKQLPPRAQKGRFLKFHSNEGQVSDTMSDPGFEGRVM